MTLGRTEVFRAPPARTGVERTSALSVFIGFLHLTAVVMINEKLKRSAFANIRLWGLARPSAYDPDTQPERLRLHEE
jgi:hypothetical protein